MPQGVFETISPPDGPPPGCVTTYSPLFSLHVLDSSYSGAPGFIGRSCMQDGILMVRLADGVLIDGLGRIGSIVANRQFQFDGPPAQAGAIYTGGFAVCDDGTMSLGGSNQFFQCSSGDCECHTSCFTSNFRLILLSSLLLSPLS